MKIDYKNPLVSSYLVLGVVFLILGFTYGWLFFLLASAFIFGGMKANNKRA